MFPDPIGIVHEPYKVVLQFAFEWIRSPEWNAPGYRNPGVTLWYILAGRRRLLAGAQAFDLQPGEVVLIPPNTTFMTEGGEGERGAIHYLSASVSAYMHGIEWSELYGLPPRFRIQNIEDGQRLKDSWYNLVRAWQPRDSEKASSRGDGMLSISQAARQLQTQAVCLNWFAEMIRVLEPHLMTPEPVIDERVREVCAFIQRSYAAPIRLGDLAKVANTSEGHLRLLFRTHLMVSPYQYLLQVRIGKAQELLLATNRPLADIAAEVGFEEYSHFLATFRKIVGMSPSHYRKNNSLYQ
ncbi:helix-turn-helix domain-containing protein [Paenibacillus cineris]|uniref:HTH araC/xylS-type domain-containing protein n=2 Tax=Paenibacillus TaxID=44249 RepID=A0ABQ4LBW6_9BACL|nr:helix-turn-helix domain-containing protein [Paenibacillus cineris]GIO54061.1 hypothetical protein J21TS7_23790 [Paenibacillus cineris]